MEIGSDSAVVVTGGASGLGEAVARGFAGAGAQVTIFDMNAEAGARVAAAIGGRFCAVDVSDARSVAAGFDGLGAAPLRVVVNCAGIAAGAKTVGRDGPHDPALFARTVGVNLIGTFNVASQGAAAMACNAPANGDGERGVIINTASVAAFEGQVGQIAYSASKGGVVGMTLPMARDLASLGIRVVAIAPGLFRTPMLAGLPEEVQDSLGAQVPFPARLGDPADYAALARHIVANPMLNGEVIRLDGAIRMSPR